MFVFAAGSRSYFLQKIARASWRSHKRSSISSPEKKRRPTFPACKQSFIPANARLNTECVWCLVVAFHKEDPTGNTFGTNVLNNLTLLWCWRWIHPARVPLFGIGLHDSLLILCPCNATGASTAGGVSLCRGRGSSSLVRRIGQKSAAHL